MLIVSALCCPSTMVQMATWNSGFLMVFCTVLRQLERIRCNLAGGRDQVGMSGVDNPEVPMALVDEADQLEPVVCNHKPEAWAAADSAQARTRHQRIDHIRQPGELVAVD